MRYKRNDHNKELIQNLKRGDTGTRKCGCPFKLCGYQKLNNKWTFSIICSMHNHRLCHKLDGNSIACLLNFEEKKHVSNMKFNMFEPKNIIATLKRKRLKNLSNIKQVYNV